jgi:hypothetical protein
VSHAILLGEGRPDEGEGYELEIGGSRAFVIELATRLGLYPGEVPSLETPIRPEDAEVVLDAESADESGEEDDESVADFHRRYAARVPGGKLREEEHILAFAYYLEHSMSKPSWTPFDITTCFSMAGVSQPRNMIGALVDLARNQATIEADDEGEYHLTSRGRVLIETVLRG